MTAPDRRRNSPEHPWCGIDLDVYERHMEDPRVGQLQQLRDITGQQLAAHPFRTVGILGVAGGNGLDLIDPRTTQAVYGYDINPDYLHACEARHRASLGDRLHLIETSIDRSVRIERVDLVIANLIIEYVGTQEFAAFAAVNAPSIGVLSCVIQRNDKAGFVSATDHSASFDALASVSSDIDPDTLTSAMEDAGFEALNRREYPLPNGKALVRQDFQAFPRS
ncbi:class I SAM-dependent methyltransferase [Streptomyces sp. NPDC055089]